LIITVEEIIEVIIHHIIEGDINSGSAEEEAKDQ
jgi:hypothetical protein